MERALTYITLDVSKIDSGQLIKAKRGDSARRLVVSLSNRGRPYIPGEGVTAVFYERKPDGNPCFNACDIDGCTVTYDFTGQTTNVVGLAACEIRLYDAENHLLTSPRFELLVDATEYQEGDVPDSSPEYTALTEMVSKGTELIRDLTDVQAGLEPIRDATIQAAQEAEASAGLAELAAQRSDADARAALRAAEEAGRAAVDAVSLAGDAADSAQAANQAYVEAERMTTRAETAREAAQTAAEEARTAAEEAKGAAGTGGGGAGYVASDEPPEDTKALWVDTAEPEEAVALGVTAVETAEGVELYCTDELGTTKVTVRNGKDGAPGDTPVKGKDYFDGEPGDDGITPHIGDNGNWFIGDNDTGKPSRGEPGPEYELTDEDKQEIAGIAAGMVPGGGGGFSLPLLYELTTTEEVRWIDTGDSAFQAKNILIISLLSKATETNEADYAMSGSFHTEEERANYPWSNLAVVREVASGLARQYNRLFSAVGFRGDGGGWTFIHHIRTEVNTADSQGKIQTRSHVFPAQREPITGIIIGDAKAATDTTRVFGVGTTLQIWGC